MGVTVVYISLLVLEGAGAGEEPAVDPPADDDEAPVAEEPAPPVGGPDPEGGPVEGPEEGPDEGPLLAVLPGI